MVLYLSLSSRKTGFQTDLFASDTDAALDLEATVDPDNRSYFQWSLPWLFILAQSIIRRGCGWATTQNHSIMNDKYSSFEN